MEKKTSSRKTIKRVFKEFTEVQATVAYLLIGQALEEGRYDKEGLVLFDGEERMVIDFLLNEAMEEYYK